MACLSTLFKVDDRRMSRHSVIPQHDRVGAPSNTSLVILALIDVVEQEFQDGFYEKLKRRKNRKSKKLSSKGNKGR